MKFRILAILLFLFASLPAAAQRTDAEYSSQMKVEFQKFYDLLQKGAFDSAVSYVSDDYIESIYFSEKQMSNLLKSNFSNWTAIPNLKISQAGVLIEEPKNLVKMDEKVYGVLLATMTIDFTGEDDDAVEDIKPLFELVEEMSQGRYSFGELKPGPNSSFSMDVKDKRLVAAIYNESTQKYQFAMSELGLKSTFENFLPAAILLQMEEQL